MKTCTLFVKMVTLCMFVLAAVAVAQDDKKTAPDKRPSPEETAKMMQEWLEMMQPGEGHKHLDYFVGHWKTETKMYMGGPGDQPMVSSGTSAMKWVLDKRFIMDEHDGSMMGQPYRGIGLTGYNNFRNMYTSVWFSNMGTEVLTMTGMRDPKTGNFTYYGEMDEPQMNVVGRTVKYSYRIIDKDTFVFEIIDLHAGDDYKVVEVKYNRQKDE